MSFLVGLRTYQHPCTSIVVHFAFIPKEQLAEVLRVLPVLITKFAMGSLWQRTRASRVLATLIWKFRMSVVMAARTSCRVVVTLPILPPVHINAGKKLRMLILSSPPGKHSDDKLA